MYERPEGNNNQWLSVTNSTSGMLCAVHEEFPHKVDGKVLLATSGPGWRLQGVCACVRAGVGVCVSSLTPVLMMILQGKISPIMEYIGV